MSYLVLARKWRPQNFEELVGQAPVARTLQNAIASGRIGHGFLFTGPRGVGKTSTARILAKALNCVKGPTPHPCGECDSCREVAGQGSVDVLEIDGASNNSVEDIRNLRERVLYGGVRDRYKIYIIDEVHMLTGPAFNALLKTLEEPPSHVIFIFATTEVQKIPATILSRTQRFDFRRIASRDLAAQLKKIMEAEKVPCSAEALALVARAAGGSLRDAQTLLDQVISFVGQEAGGQAKPVGVDDVLQVLGGVDESQAVLALKAALAGELEPALTWVKGLYDKGGDLRLALASLSDCLRGLLLVKSTPHPAEHCDLLPETLQTLAGFAKEVGLSRVMGLLKAASETETQLRYASNQRLALESLFIRFSPHAPGSSLGELFDQLSLMEERLTSKPALALAEAGHPQAEIAAPAKVEVKAVPVVRQEPAPPPPAPVSIPVPEPVLAKPVEAGTPVLAAEQIEETKAPGPFGIETVKLEWEKVAEKAHELSVMLGSSVRDVEITSADDKSIRVTVRNPMQKDTLESPDHRPRLEAIFKEIFGRDLALKVSFTPAGGPAKPKTKGGLSQEEIDKAMTPEVKRIQELFNAEIVEIKKI